MAKQLNLCREKTSRLYFSYLFPSVSASLVTSIYILADTIMIGRGCGAEALAALNLVLPLFACLFALGMLCGIGGGVLYSVAKGNGDSKRAKQIWSTALLMAALASGVILLITSIWLEPLCYLLGAEETNLQMVKDYAQFVVYGTPAYVFSAFLQAFVRNDQNPKRAMAAVMVGAITNIVLDYIFIFQFDMGLTGGAAATLIGNCLTTLTLCTHFLSKQNGLHFTSVNGHLVKEILTAGAPSFFIEAATGLITFTFNQQMLRYLGNLGVAVYGVVANYALVLQSLFNGIGQAAQPIMATNHGANLHQRVASVRKMGFVSVLLVASAAVLAAYTIPEWMTALFVDVTPDILQYSIPALRIYFLAFWFLGVNLFATTSLQSIVQPTPALVIMVLRGVVLPIVLALLLPQILSSGMAVFAAVPVSEVVVCMVSIGCIRHFDKRYRPV